MKPMVTALKICTLLIITSFIFLAACSGSDISLQQPDDITGVAAEYSPECPPPEPCG
jgi:hypothetical protein